MGITLAPDTQSAHLHINAIQVWHHHQRDRVQVQGNLRSDTAGTLRRGHGLAFKMNDYFIIPGSPGHHLQEIVRIVVGPHRQSTSRLTGRVVALPYAQRLAQHIQYALNQPGIRLRLIAIGQFKSLPGMRTQRQPCLTPKTRRYRRLIENAPLQQQRQAINALGRFRIDAFVNQGVNQLPVTHQAISAGTGQTQRLAQQGILICKNESDERGVVGRHQSGVVHGTCEPGGFVLQGLGIHGFQPLLVNHGSGIFAAGPGGPVEAGNQPVRTPASTTKIGLRIRPAQSNLGDHAAHVGHLDRALLKNPPDFFDQTVDHMLVADVISNVLDHSLTDQRELALLPLGFTGHAEQQAQVDGQDLSQVVVRLFGRYRGMQIVASGHGKQPQFAESLNDHGVGTLALQRMGCQCGEKNTGFGPVRTGEHAGQFEAFGALLDNLAATRLQQDPSGSIQYARKLAGPCEGPALFHGLDRVIQPLHQLVEIHSWRCAARLVIVQTIILRAWHQTRLLLMLLLIIHRNRGLPDVSGGPA